MKIRHPKYENHHVAGDPFTYCEMTGFKCRVSETVIQWDGRRVLSDWADTRPADRNKPKIYPNELKQWPRTRDTPEITAVDPVTQDSNEAPRVDDGISAVF
jgi:hypothetical protein